MAFQLVNKAVVLSADLIDEVTTLKLKEISVDERDFYLSQLKRTIVILGKTLLHYER